MQFHFFQWVRVNGSAFKNEMQILFSMDSWPHIPRLGEVIRYTPEGGLALSKAETWIVFSVECLVVKDKLTAVYVEIIPSSKGERFVHADRVEEPVWDGDDSSRRIRFIDR